jgi:type VI secretion system VgrG family protein
MAATDILQTLLEAVRQTDRLLRLHTVLGGDALVAEHLEGWEAVDHEGFRFELTALSAEAALPLARLLGTPVLVELATTDGTRPFHGHVTGVERVGGNGGLARYRLTIEPWLSLLRHRQDSYAYHDASVIEIVEQVFGHYAQGVVAPAWRWQLADRSLYAKRSLTSQYQESDLAFVRRLLAEEGVFYWFEHRGDAASSALGSHTLVLADSNSAFEPADGRHLDFHRADAAERVDSVQQWAPARRWQTGRVARASWDYRSLSTRPAAAEATQAAVDADDQDTAGPYAWRRQAEGERRARQHLDALHVASQPIEGAGTVRQLAPGQRFVLDGHPSQDQAPWLCLRVEHRVRNNLGADVQTTLERQLAVAGATQAGHAKESDAYYHNRFLALPASQTYRPHTAEGHGLRLHPIPSASGPQTAIVVGDGSPIHTDRDHRVKLQAHWQRGGNAASRQEHPRAANAPADAGAGTWARVAAPVAGANWGGVSAPRVGQEVWVDFLEGDIDRPVVAAALYNGQGNEDAPHNQQAGGPSGATGNAAAWFAGNGHAGVLSGLKSQDLSSSASGTGGHRQLRFDDSAGQPHVQLATTDHDTALTLGHLKQTEDNQRVADRGYGAELVTQAQGALRGGAGLLLSTAAGAAQMEAGGSVAALDQHRQLAQGLAETAQKQQAGLDAEPAPAELPAIKASQQIRDSLAATRAGRAAGNGIGGGEGDAPSWSTPHWVAHGEDGLAALTPQDLVWVSGTATTLGAGQDIDLTVQGQTMVAAAKGLALYTVGSAPASGRPVGATGIALHAASGPVNVQAQQDAAALTAEQAVTVASVQSAVTVQGHTHTLLTAAGAYLRLEGGNIEIGAPGQALFHAGDKVLTGPKAGDAVARLPTSAAKLCEFTAGAANASGSALMGVA